LGQTVLLDFATTGGFMASIRLNRQAAHSGQLPQVCICCGGPARQLVRHEFRFEPTWLILLTTVFPKVQMFLSYETFNLNVPVCESHVSRFKWPTIAGLATAAILFLLLIPIIGLSVTGNQDKLLIVIPIFLLVVLGYVVTRFALLFSGPRVVAYSSGALDLEGVADAFAHHARGGGGYGQSAPQYAAQAYTGNYGLTQVAYQNAYRPRGGSSTRTILIVAAAVGIPVLLIGVIGAIAIAVASSPRFQQQRMAAQMRREMNQEFKEMRAEMRSNLAPISTAPMQSPRPLGTPSPTVTSPATTQPNNPVIIQPRSDFDSGKFRVGEIAYWTTSGRWYQGKIVKAVNPGWQVTYFDESGMEVNVVVDARILTDTCPTFSDPQFAGTAVPPKKGPSTTKDVFEVGDVVYFQFGNSWYQATVTKREELSKDTNLYTLTYYDDFFKRETTSKRFGTGLQRQLPAGAKVVTDAGKRPTAEPKSSAPANDDATSATNFKPGDVVYVRLLKWVRGTVVGQRGSLVEVRYTDELTKADRTIPFPPELLRRDPPDRNE
jgi:hypothetical protein